jgi:hypothetical protein
MNAPILIVFLAVVCERLIEYFGAPLASTVKPYAAALVGVALCVLFQADVFGLLGYPAIVPYAGSVVSGLLIAGGANYINDLLARFLAGRGPTVQINTSATPKPTIAEDVAYLRQQSVNNS